MVTKAQILDLIQAGYDEVLFYASIVPEVERAAPGEPDRWGPKDILAHIGEWQMQSLEKMAGSHRADPDVAGIDGDDEANAIIFQKYRQADWQEILSLLESANQGIRERVQSFSEDDLNQPGRVEYAQNGPLWRRLIGDEYQHLLAHLNPEFMRLGARDHVQKWQEEQMSLLSGLDGSDEWQGTCLYNTACGWALLGEPQKALPLLEKAFRLRPVLAEWSRQDSDLESLRDTPEFEALLKQ